MADEVLTADEAKAVAVLREYSQTGEVYAWHDARRALALIDRLAAKVASDRREVEAVIEHMPKHCVVPVREGGGFENIYATLAVSVAKLTAKVRAGEKVIDAMEHRIGWLEDLPQIGEIMEEETDPPTYVAALAAYRSVT